MRKVTILFSRHKGTNRVVRRSISFKDRVYSLTPCILEPFTVLMSKRKDTFNFTLRTSKCVSDACHRRATQKWWCQMTRFINIHFMYHLLHLSQNFSNTSSQRSCWLNVYEGLCRLNMARRMYCKMPDKIMPVKCVVFGRKENEYGYWIGHNQENVKCRQQAGHYFVSPQKQ